MNRIHLYSFSALALLWSSAVMAQEKNKKDENIGTEVVNVVRPYEATISDAFKVRETPNLNDDDNTQKKKIQYTINSFPVASTFVPEKGKAAAVDKDPRLAAFNNYALFGLGNYLNLRGELFLTKKINDTDYFAGMVNFFSSQGGLKDQILDDYYSKAAVEVTYGSKREKFNWNIDLGVKNQMVNWYGLPVKDVDFSNFNAAGIDEEQVYRTAFVGGKMEFNNSPLAAIDVQYKRFWDAFDSGENRFYIKPRIETALGEQDLTVNLVMDYVGVDYETFQTQSKESNTQMNFGVEPSIAFQDETYSLQLGAGLYFNNSKVKGESDNAFYIYPQVKASFNLVDNLLIAYTGAEGGLRQNSYADFVAQNPFISPGNPLMPTSEQFNLYLGLKGKLDNTISYNIRGSYKSEDDKAFFNTNVYQAAATNLGYQYGNSFQVLYSNLKTLNFYGELRFDFEKNVTMGMNAAFSHYTTDLQEAWNMPTAKVGADIQVEITDKWFAGTEVYFVGERKDLFSDGRTTSVNPDPITTVKTLESYVDWNLKLGYRPTKNWTVFLNGNNLLNKNYENWNNFQVQGIQVMGGAMYKFDL
ncbi:TonB-dependent receptor [Flavobacterium sp. JP2137]|uniref:TonB-dependent receptor n=1 Tax=Flavobacterium sp. JP2137 TaxID=3414510 RepID=UPI003D2FD52D